MRQKKSIKFVRSFLSMVVMAATLFCSESSVVKADVPYDTYSYNYWGEEVKDPHAYLYTETIDGLGLSYPSDMFLYKDLIYIADTGNSRVVVTDAEGNLTKVFSTAKSDSDYLKEPQGVFVTNDGHLYVADTGNGRLVEYDKNGMYVREIGRPVTNLIAESQSYMPTKVVVDSAGRIYVTAYGINMGLVEFNYEGEFQGFLGATQVSVSMFEYIWKNYFSTEAQQIRMETIVPTEYSNIFVDNEDFIYATINNLSSEDMESGADAVRRLNQTGKDVLRRLGTYDPIGDLVTTTFGWDWSSFVDVAATEYGCYFMLDKTDGKIFAYDNDSVSLFAFGRNGIREGNFQNPVSLGLSADEKTIYVLDNMLNSILVFEITEYGEHLLNAIRLNNLGDAEGSTREWQEVLKYNSNSEMAYVGLGKTYLAEGQYEKAMECFEFGNHKEYYSKAFQYHRKELMEQYFPVVVVVAAVLVILFFVWKKARNYKKWIGEVKCYVERH